MERKAMAPGKPFIAIFLLYMVCFWISHGHAFESWLGEVSTKVNLRTSPGLDQEIITVLDEAIVVEVIDESGGWYRVVTLWETPEHKGWVYGQHIRKTSNKEKASEVPPVMRGEERKTEAPLSVEKTRETEIPLVVESVIGPEIPAPVEKLKATEVPAKVEEVTETIPPRQHKDRAPHPESASPADTTNKAAPAAKSTNNEREGTYQETRVFLRSLVRLASVIISCLALIFSIKAFRLAQRCYQEMTRFQVKFQDPPEKGGPLEYE